MFKKILIANRGEIACRVAATARRMGIKTVAVYSDADTHAKHVQVCDEAVHIGGSTPKDSYLRWERILQAAKDTGAQAVHPGYGFLSENEDFANACAAAGLVFIGPPASAIQAMGLKAQSKQLMEKAGVPLVPGYHGRDQDPALLQSEADRMGYPVLIKASAGGGGKGMRVVETSAGFAEALASCKREAINSFGDDAVLIEKYVQRPRHIEIQVFADSHGNCVHLFERDCSVQRRHQKVLEEAPAPGMTQALREQMGAAAVAAAKAVNYVGAGTVEFIVEQASAYGLEGAEVGFAAGPPRGETAPLGGSAPHAVGSVGAEGFAAGPPRGETAPLGGSAPHAVGSVGAEGFAAGPPRGETAPLGGSAPHAVGSVGARFFFMEMNTRLQVEHPVTEAITGLDLVEWQLRVASGEPLPLQQDQLRIHGHAIEARICAENPDKQFLPATGTLQVYRKPKCSSFELAQHKNLQVRVDDGVREGDSISPFYDSMVAKLIVHGDTRERALALLDEALAQTRIVGLTTNVQFLRHVVRSDAFASAKLDTALIQREEKELFHQEPVGLAMAAAAVVANTLQGEKALEGPDPFSRRDGWKAYGNTTRRFGLVFHGEAHQAVLTYLHDGALQLKVASFEGGLRWRVSEGGDASDANRVNNSNATLAITFGAQHMEAQVFHHAEGSDDVAHVFTPQGATRITVVDALTHAGEVQEAGGRLTAPMPGKVVSFAVKSGDSVKAGQALAVMEAMKMEHTIAAPADGEVLELLFAPGDQVAEGDELLTLKV